MYYRKYITLFFSLILILNMASCANGENKNEEKTEDTKKLEKVKEGEDMNKDLIVTLENGNDKKELKVDLATHPVATIEINDGNKIQVVLLPELAENTANNFIELANKGYYDGLIFHRVIKNFMIQGGCPNGTGMGDPGYSIKAEFVSDDGYLLPHNPGVISMARSQDPDSAGSQFFIMHKSTSRLNGLYASFGIVIDEESQKEVDKIASVKTGAADRPDEDVVMTKVSVVLNGYESKEVEKIK